MLVIILRGDMKPLGQKHKRQNFTDCHPPKGFENWWEWIGEENKAADKLAAKKDIQQQLQEKLCTVLN